MLLNVSWNPPPAFGVLLTSVAFHDWVMVNGASNSSVQPLIAVVPVLWIVTLLVLPGPKSAGVWRTVAVVLWSVSPPWLLPAVPKSLVPPAPLFPTSTPFNVELNMVRLVVGVRAVLNPKAAVPLTGTLAFEAPGVLWKT